MTEDGIKKILRSVTDSGGGGDGGGDPGDPTASSVHNIRVEVYDDTSAMVDSIEMDDGLDPGSGRYGTSPWVGGDPSVFWNGSIWLAFCSTASIDGNTGWFARDNGDGTVLPLGTWSDESLPDFTHPSGWYIQVFNTT